MDLLLDSSVEEPRGSVSFNALTNVLKDFLGTNSGELIQNVIKTELLSGNSPLKSQILKVATNEILNNVHMSKNKRHVVIGEALSYADELKLVESFGNLELSFTRVSYNSHGYYAASRRCEYATILGMLNYSRNNCFNLGDRDDFICDIGGNWFYHFSHSHDNIHSCCPPLDERDSARHNSHINEVVLRSNNRLNTFTEYQSMLLADIENSIFHPPSGNRLYCRNKAQDCTRTAYYGILIHSLYDISPRALVDAFDRKKISIAYATVLFDSMILLKKKGAVNSGIYYEIKGDKIIFSFVDDSSIDYVHNLSNYLSYFTMNVIRSSLGNLYMVEMLENRNGVQFIKFIKLDNRDLSLYSHISHKIWMKELKDKVKVKFFVPTNECYCYPWERYIAGNKLHFKKLFKPITFYTTKELFIKTFDYALRVTEANFKPAGLYMYASSFASRTTLFSGDVIKKDSANTDPKELFLLANAVYVYVYCLKYDTGRTIQTVLNNIKMTRGLVDKSLWEKLLTAAELPVNVMTSYFPFIHRMVHSAKEIHPDLLKFFSEEVAFEQFDQTIINTDLLSRQIKRMLFMKEKRATVHLPSIFNIDVECFSFDVKNVLRTIIKNNYELEVDFSDVPNDLFIESPIEKTTTKFINDHINFFDFSPNHFVRKMISTDSFHTNTIVHIVETHKRRSGEEVDKDISFEVSNSGNNRVINVWLNENGVVRYLREVSRIFRGRSTFPIITLKNFSNYNNYSVKDILLKYKVSAYFFYDFTNECSFLNRIKLPDLDEGFYKGVSRLFNMKKVAPHDCDFKNYEQYDQINMNELPSYLNFYFKDLGEFDIDKFNNRTITNRKERRGIDFGNILKKFKQNVFPSVLKKKYLMKVLSEYSASFCDHNKRILYEGENSKYIIHGFIGAYYLKIFRITLPRDLKPLKGYNLHHILTAEEAFDDSYKPSAPVLDPYTVVHEFVTDSLVIENIKRLVYKRFPALLGTKILNITDIPDENDKPPKLLSIMPKIEEETHWNCNHSDMLIRLCHHKSGRCLYQALNCGGVDYEEKIVLPLLTAYDNFNDEYVDKDQLMKELKGEEWGTVYTIIFFSRHFKKGVCVNDIVNNTFVGFNTDSKEIVHLRYTGDHYDYVEDKTDTTSETSMDLVLDVPVQAIVLKSSSKENYIALKPSLDDLRTALSLVPDPVYEKAKFVVGGHVDLKPLNYLNNSALKLDNLLDILGIKDGSVVFDCCGAPGGFLQVLSTRLKDIQAYTVSLASGLKYRFDRILNMYVTQLTGGHSDITRKEFFDMIVKHMGHRSVDYFLADGAVITNGKHLNGNEEENLKLITSELMLGVALIRPEGTILLKLLDCFTDSLLELIINVLKNFRSFEIIVPVGTRTVSSEKYLLLRNYCSGCRDEQSFDEELYGKLNRVVNIQINGIKNFLAYVNNENYQTSNIDYKVLPSVNPVNNQSITASPYIVDLFELYEDSLENRTVNENKFLKMVFTLFNRNSTYNTILLELNKYFKIKEMVSMDDLDKMESCAYLISSKMYEVFFNRMRKTRKSGVFYLYISRDYVFPMDVQYDIISCLNVTDKLIIRFSLADKPIMTFNDRYIQFDKYLSLVKLHRSLCDRCLNRDTSELKFEPDSKIYFDCAMLERVLHQGYKQGREYHNILVIAFKFVERDVLRDRDCFIDMNDADNTILVSCLRTKVLQEKVSDSIMQFLDKDLNMKNLEDVKRPNKPVKVMIETDTVAYSRNLVELLKTNFPRMVILISFNSMIDNVRLKEINTLNKKINCNNVVEFAPTYLYENTRNNIMINMAVEAIALIKFSYETIRENISSNLEITVTHINDGTMAYLQIGDPTFGVFDNHLRRLVKQPKTLYTTGSGFDGENFVDFDEKKKMYDTTKRYVGFSKDTVLVNQQKILDNLKHFDMVPLINSNLRIVLMLGVPGCGKTTHIIRNNADLIKSNTLILTTTRESRLDMMQRWQAIHGEEDDLTNYIRTLDSYLINSDRQVTNLYIDEAMMRHPGEIMIAICKSGATNVKLYGDQAQIPFVNRVRGATLIRDSFDYLHLEVEHMFITYRCPQDIAYLLNCMGVYEKQVKSTSKVEYSVKYVNISGFENVPKDDRVQYLTMTQDEKDRLKQKGFKRVNTVHEYQGKQHPIVYLCRDVTKDYDIYNNLAYVLVAISRHTESFCYYSVMIKDTTINFIKNKPTLEQLKAIRHVMAGGFYSAENSITLERVIPFYESGGVVDKVVFSHDAYNVTPLRVIPGMELVFDEVEPYLMDCYADVDCYVVLQGLIDSVFPRSAWIDRNYDNYDIENAYMNNKLATDYGYSDNYRPLYVFDDSLTPKLQTPIQKNICFSTHQVLKAFMERNGNVPDYLGEVYNPDLVNTTFEIFRELYIEDKQLFDTFADHIIDINTSSINNWLRTQKQEVLKMIASIEFPVYFDTTKPNFYNFTLKKMSKPVLDDTAGFKSKSPQTIAFMSKLMNIVFCPIVKEMKSRLIAVLKKNVKIFTDISTDEFVDHLNKFFPPYLLKDFKYTLELDFSKYDKSQGVFSRLYEDKILIKLGLPPELLPLWHLAHKYTKLIFVNKDTKFMADIIDQRKSGDPATLFGNTIHSLSVIARVFYIKVVMLELPHSMFLMVLGDDMYLFSTVVNNDYNKLQDIFSLFNLECKILTFKYPYFCSKFVLPVDDTHWAVLPDVVKLVVKLGRSDIPNLELLEEYRISLCDLCKDFKNVHYHEVLSSAINDRYKVHIDGTLVCSAICKLVYDKEEFGKFFTIEDNYNPNHYTTQPNQTLNDI